MKTSTESVVIITNRRGEVVGLVRKDVNIQKNLIYTVNDAKMDEIADMITGKSEEPYVESTG